MAKKILKFALSPVAAVAGLFGGKKKAAETAPEAAPVMPLADDEAVRRAKKRSTIGQMGRSGRSSTILTDDSDKLGG